MRRRRRGLPAQQRDGRLQPDPRPHRHAGRIGTPANLIAPGKRMLSSQSPTIVLKDGRVRLVTGSPGGRTIPNTTLWVVLNVLEFGLDPRAAVDAPRTHHPWFPDVLTSKARPGPRPRSRPSTGTGTPLADGRHQGNANTIVVEPAPDGATAAIHGVADRAERRPGLGRLMLLESQHGDRAVAGHWPSARQENRIGRIRAQVGRDSALVRDSIGTGRSHESRDRRATRIPAKTSLQGQARFRDTGARAPRCTRRAGLRVRPSSGVEHHGDEFPFRESDDPAAGQRRDLSHASFVQRFRQATRSAEAYAGAGFPGRDDLGDGPVPMAFEPRRQRVAV